MVAYIWTAPFAVLILSRTPIGEKWQRERSAVQLGHRYCDRTGELGLEGPSHFPLLIEKRKSSANSWNWTCAVAQVALSAAGRLRALHCGL